MTGVITSLPPLVEQPPGSNSSNPAGLPGVTYTAAIPTLPQTWTGLQTYTLGSMQFAGSTSGDTFLNAAAIASGTVILPAIVGSDTLLANNNTATVTNKSIDGLANTLTNIPASAFGTVTGTGAVVLQTGPSIINPAISGATITTSTYNGNIWTAGTGTLTLGAGKTTTISNTLTFTGTDGSTAAFGTGGTVAYQGGTLAQFGATTSLQLAGVISDETGTGALVFANGPTLIAPLLGTPASGVATNLTGTAAGLTAGNVTTNANLTGPVTSVGNATTIGANQVSRAMEAQGVARSVVGVTGNGTANVADIQGTSSQFLGVNSAGTALAFQTMTGDVTLSGPASTIAANAVTNAKLATMAAFTLKGNNTSGSATPTDVDIAALTAKGSPASTDLVMISDQAASGAWKKVTVSSLASAGAVATFNGQTGAVVSYFKPQGRLTLTTLTPVMTATVSGATTVYYTPYQGNMVPIYDGTNMAPTAVAEVSQLTTDATKSPAAVAASKVYDVFVWNDAGTIRATRGPAWTNSTTRGYTFTMVNGILLNTSIITNGPAASRGTWVGTIASNASSTIDYIFGAAASGGTAAVLNVWNTYNRVSTSTTVTDSGTSYTYAVNTIRQARASSANQIAFVLGAQEDGVVVSYTASIDTAAGGAQSVGVGFDVTNAYSIGPYAVQCATVLSFNGSSAGTWAAPIGTHAVFANESSLVGTNTFNTGQYGVKNMLMATIRN